MNISDLIERLEHHKSYYGDQQLYFANYNWGDNAWEINNNCLLTTEKYDCVILLGMTPVGIPDKNQDVNKV